MINPDIPEASEVLPTDGVPRYPPIPTSEPSSEDRWGPTVFIGSGPSIADDHGQKKYGISVQCYKDLPQPHLDKSYIDENKETLCGSLADAGAQEIEKLPVPSTPPLPSGVVASSRLTLPTLAAQVVEIQKKVSFPGGSLSLVTGDEAEFPAKGNARQWLHDVCLSAMALLVDNRQDTDHGTDSACVADGDASKIPLKGGIVQVTGDGKRPEMALNCLNCVITFSLLADWKPVPVFSNPLPVATGKNAVIVGLDGSDEFDLSDDDVTEVETQDSDQELDDQQQEIDDAKKSLEEAADAKEAVENDQEEGESDICDDSPDPSGTSHPSPSGDSQGPGPPPPVALPTGILAWEDVEQEVSMLDPDDQKVINEVVSSLQAKDE